MKIYALSSGSPFGNLCPWRKKSRSNHRKGTLYSITRINHNSQLLFIVHCFLKRSFHQGEVLVPQRPTFWHRRYQRPVLCLPCFITFVRLGSRVHRHRPCSEMSKDRMSTYSWNNTSFFPKISNSWSKFTSNYSTPPSNRVVYLKVHMQNVHRQI